MFTLIVKVYAAAVCMENRKSLFERQLSVPDSLSVDYDGIKKTLHFLFGSKTIIVFELWPC